MALPSLPKSLTRQRRELTKFWLRFRVAIIAALVAVVAVTAGLYAWSAWEESAAESAARRVQATAKYVALDVQNALGAALGSVDKAIEPTSLARLIEEGEPAALHAKESEIASMIPGAVGVRILPASVQDPNTDAMPPVTYASLEMMRAAVASGKPPPVEVLLLGEKEEHAAVLRAVPGADGAVRGFVLVGLDVKLLSAAVAKADLPAGYVELVQAGGKGNAVVGRKGNATFKQGAPAATLPVGGSTLRVLFWAAAASVEAEESGLPLVPIIAVVVLLVAASAGFVFMRKGRGRGKEATAAVQAPGEEDDRPSLTQKLRALNEESDGPSASPDAPEAPPAGAGLADEIFRAYDVRGVVGKTLTVEVVRQLGLAIGSEAYDRGQQTLCVGCDGRSSSPELAAALIEGLRESGRDVIDVGRVPTPVLYFATFYLETGSGVMITGSHNPPEYNGLKIMLGGDTLFGDDIQALKTRIQKGDFVSGSGKSQSMDISADYIRRVSEDVPVALGNAFKVVVDCGNGIAGDFAPKLIRALGHDVVELFCEVDGNFPNHHPDPSQPENLADLIAAVKSHDADLGFAFDGDGDRLGVVDSGGHIVWPDAQMMLYARDVLSRNPGAEIVFDVKCSSRLAKVIEKLGGKPVMFKTGHSYIKNKLKETGAPLAGEMSGHIFFKERWYGFDDALYTGARMLEILMGFKQKPAEVFAKLPAGVSTPELKVEMNEGENVAFMESLRDTEQFSDAKVTTIDGVRVDWKDGWGLVRASNTTPSLVLRFEGDDEQALARVKETFRKLLLDKKPDLSLPF